MTLYYSSFVLRDFEFFFSRSNPPPLYRRPLKILAFVYDNGSLVGGIVII